MAVRPHSPFPSRASLTYLVPYYLGVSRCFPFWQEVLACYVVNTTSDDVSGKKKCQPALEDYYECLHHKKEVCSAPMNSIADQSDSGGSDRRRG